MAYDSLWIVFVSVLAAFDIEAVKNEKGEPMMPSMELEGSFSVYVFVSLRLKGRCAELN